MAALKVYFKDIASSIVSTFEGMAVTMSWVFRKPITVQYPYEKRDPAKPVGGPDTLPERYRGFLEVDMDICTGCLACQRACPIDCISIELGKIAAEDPEAPPVRVMTRFDVDLAKCMFCGLCSEPCPTGAIRHTPQFEGTVLHVEHLCVRFVDPRKPVPPYKVKKGEDAPASAPHGSIVRRLLVDQPWDRASLNLPAVEPPPPNTAASPE